MTSWPYPRYAAHRGAGKLAPENTLAAMRVGHAHGYRMVEFDVHLSGDGVPFLLHDDTLNRTTTGRGRADALTWAELAKLDAGSWHSPEYAGEPPPTLAAVARWAIANGVACNIEIKPVRGRERDTGAAVALDAHAQWQSARVPPLLSSFSTAALDAAREIARELPRAWLIEERLPGNWREHLERLACVALDAEHTLLTPELVRDLHGTGLRVATWTVNDPIRAVQLANWGVDTIITDAIDVVRPA